MANRRVRTEMASPVGPTVEEVARRRLQQSERYRAVREQYAPYEQIARIVIRLRMEHGLTQRELARRVGTSYSAISRIESGQHRTSVETLRRIAHAFDCRLLLGFGSDGPQREGMDLVAI